MRLRLLVVAPDGNKFEYHEDLKSEALRFAQNCGGRLYQEITPSMTLDEIRSHVKAGKVVHWGSKAYEVKLWSDGQFVVACPSTNYAIGLSYVRDGVEHVNAKLEEFFLGGAQ